MLRIIFILSIMLASACNQQVKEKTAQPSPNDSLQSSVSTAKAVVDGEFIKRYDNGVVEARGMMKAGKRDGVWKSFYKDGMPWSETTFVDGKKEGSTSSWYENGQKRYEGFYKNDVESGLWIFWDDKGNIATKKNYDLDNEK
ncbi:MAG: toxin-antitoxin system YwqK family antitoxin [Bacteroidetes bacterium]|nr:toxin-antitoxin system YwqK family antitoxin [Bacteroidota bacterium]